MKNEGLLGSRLEKLRVLVADHVRLFPFVDVVEVKISRSWIPPTNTIGRRVAIPQRPDSRKTV